MAYWPVFDGLLKTIKIMKNKEKLRGCHRPEQTGETWKLNKRDTLDWNLEQKRDINGKTSEIQVKSSLFDNNVPISVTKL